jgi:hypothetical protein
MLGGISLLVQKMPARGGLFWGHLQPRHVSVMPTSVYALILDVVAR